MAGLFGSRCLDWSPVCNRCMTNKNVSLDPFSKANPHGCMYKAIPDSRQTHHPSIITPFYLPFGWNTRIRWQLQLVQIIHGTSTGSSKDIHGIGITNTDMRITRNGRRPFRDQGGPNFGIKIKQVRIAQMSRPVMTTVQNHGVLVHYGSGTIPSPRSSTGCGDGTPLGQGKIEFVQVGSIH
jgi:hypothetical protein